MTTHTLWWITLAAGLVVAVVAIVLLQLFLNQVRRVERGSLEVWETATTVARNTATTWMLAQTPVRLDRLTEEALRHDAFLKQALGTADSTDAGGSQ
ncbi:MAG: hypothetical protein ACRBK7_18895 [Acidimicrobiales bacterium]